MPCKDCFGVEKADVRHTCRVCELMDNDTSIKRVKYCSLCSAYICEKHRGLSLYRVLAVLKDKKEKVVEVVKRRGRKKKDETEIPS